MSTMRSTRRAEAPRLPAPRYATASPAEARSFAADLSDQFLRCRRYGHMWEDYDVIEDRASAVFTVTERCGSCAAERGYEISGNTGRMITDYHIKYPDGYLSDFGRITGDARGMLVIERLRRRSQTSTGGKIRRLKPRTA